MCLWSSLAIVSLSTLVTASGILELTKTRKAELVVQACLCAHVGVSTIYLAHAYSSPAPWLRKAPKGYVFVLSAVLFCTTVFGILTPFVNAIPTIIPPLLFLLFTLSILPILTHILRVHLSPPHPTATTSKLKKRKPLRLRTAPVPTQVLIPPPLPSPASSSVLSFPSSSSQTHKHEPERVDSSIGCSAYKHPRLASTESACTVFNPADVESSAPASSAIRQRAQSIQARSRNIALTLLTSQLFSLLSFSLLLVLAFTDPDSLVLKSIQAVFTILSICGIILAFSLHGTRPVSPGTPISVSVSISQQQRQDQSNNTILPNPNPDLIEPHYAKGEARAELPGGRSRSGDNDMILDSLSAHHDPCVGLKNGDCPDDFVLGSSGHRRGPRLLRLGSSIPSRGVLHLGFSKLRRLFPVGSREEEPPTPLQDLPFLRSTLQQGQQQQHGRFASSSSSFSSPPRASRRDSRCRTPSPDPGLDVIPQEDEDKLQFVNDEGIELPVLPLHTYSSNANSGSASSMVVLGLGQLPSPPDTPRARIRTRSAPPPPLPPPPYWLSTPSDPAAHHDPIINPISTVDYSYTHEEEEQVRIGMVSPAEKPNLTVRDFFAGIDVDDDRYHQDEYACAMSGEVVDTAVSEPGHGGFFPSSSAYGRRGYVIDELEEDRITNPRVFFTSESRSPTPTPTHIWPTPVTQRSPTFSSPASWIGRRPVKSRSTMSLSLPLGSGSRSASAQRSPELPSPRLGGSGGWRRAEKFKERLMRGRFNYPGRTLSFSQSTSQVVEEGVREDVDSIVIGEGGKEKASERGKKGHKRTGTWGSISISKSPIIPTTPTLTPATFTASSASTSGLTDWEWYPFTSNKSKSSSSTHINNDTFKRKQLPSADSGQQQTGDIADFVDLTDPFASPTPGFTLPKWVAGHNGSSGAAGTTSVSDLGHSGSTNWSGCDGTTGGVKGKMKEVVWGEAESGEENEEVHGTRMTKSSAQWGKLPPVPPLPILTSFAGNGPDVRKSEKTRGRERTTRKRRKRPDSPMPMRMMSSRRLPRIVVDDHTEGLDESIGEVSSMQMRMDVPERPGSPSPPLETLSLGVSISRSMGMGLGIRGLEESMQVDDDVLGGALRRKETNTNVASMSRKSGKLSAGDTRRRRNGSPVPIPFRRMTRDYEVQEEERGEGIMMEGLDLEEVFLAQRLLRRLNSDEAMGRYM